MQKLKIGIVGAGNIACSAHLPAYQECENAYPAAIADIDYERAKNAAEKFNIPRAYSSVEEMLADANIDAVDICTWNNAHAPVCIAAAEAGKHVLCEKPMAMSLADALAMEKAVKASGVTFMLAVPGRFGYENMYLREMYERGEFGDIYYAKTSTVRRRGTPTGWFTDKKTSGGGPVIDIGVHGIDAAWYIMGCPKPVSVSAGVFFKIGDYQTKGVGRWQGTPCPDNKFDCEDSGAGIIRFENGAVLFFEASWAINGPEHTDVLLCGSKAGASMSPLTIYGERNEYLSTDQITVCPKNDKFKLEITHFADCVLNNKTPKYSLSQAVMMQKMLQGVYDSSDLGKEIIINE